MIKDSKINLKGILHNREYGWPGGDTPGEISYHHQVPPSIVLTVKKSLQEVFSPFNKIRIWLFCNYYSIFRNYLGLVDVQ